MCRRSAGPCAPTEALAFASNIALMRRMHWPAILSASVPIAFAALMPVINPIGTALILLGMTSEATPETRKALAKRIALNTVILLGVLLLTGRYLLQFFGISVPIVQAAGGLVLAAMGWGLLNAKDVTPAGDGPGPGNDAGLYFARAFYPFTFPVTVGPGGVAVMLTLGAHSTHDTLIDTVVAQAGVFVAVIAIAMVVYLSFAYSHILAARLGPSVISVMMRLISFIVVCIGAEISWSGVRALVALLPAR